MEYPVVEPIDQQSLQQRLLDAIGIQQVAGNIVKGQLENQQHGGAETYHCFCGYSRI